VRLLEESLVINCPNPKCLREFKESIFLTINSVTPPKQYNACPHCFANLEREPKIEKKEVPEQTLNQNLVPELAFKPEEVMDLNEDEESIDGQSLTNVPKPAKVSGPSFLKKFKALIPRSNGSKKNKKQISQELEAELELAKKEKERTKEKPKMKLKVKKKAQKSTLSARKEDLTSECPELFGYLANRPKDESIPQACLVCPKMVDCMLSPRDK
jgi:hypothetical protein